MTLSTTETAKTNTDPEMQTVLDLWNEEKDTFDIAKIMKVHESAVYNCLAYIRGIPTEPYAYPRDAAHDRFFSKGGWQ